MAWRNRSTTYYRVYRVTYMFLSRCHLQRLPRISIVPAHIFGKVVINKNPCFTGLRAWQQAQLGAAAHFLRMHVEKCGSLCQVERVHLSSQIRRSNLPAPMSEFTRDRHTRLSIDPFLFGGHLLRRRSATRTASP